MAAEAPSPVRRGWSLPGSAKLGAGPPPVLSALQSSITQFVKSCTLPCLSAPTQPWLRPQTPERGGPSQGTPEDFPGWIVSCGQVWAVGKGLAFREGQGRTEEGPLGGRTRRWSRQHAQVSVSRPPRQQGQPCRGTWQWPSGAAVSGAEWAWEGPWRKEHLSRGRRTCDLSDLDRET